MCRIFFFLLEKERERALTTRFLKTGTTFDDFDDFDDDFDDERDDTRRRGL